MKEQVLAFPAVALQPFLALFYMDKGVVTDPTTVKAVLAEVLNANSLRFIDRESAEQDPSWKQVIPYCVLESEGKILAYQRTKKGGESRLHDKWSIGIGGHINPIDGESNDANAYSRAFARELEEEVGLPQFHENSEILYTDEIVALIYDPSNEVGQVHFGVVHRVQLHNNPVLKYSDPALDKGSWVKASEAKTQDYENWSKLVLESGVLA